MKNYIVYDSTGKILRTGTCPDEMMEIQAHEPGELVMEGIANDLIHFIKKGRVRKREN